MRTVKAVSELTGISVRTLHYYDEIGLLCPSECTEAGYRLYDDKALERLKQILLFREFDLPLKEIRLLLDDPGLDRNQMLEMQKAMLMKKRDRLTRLIENIDRMLKGEQDMSFEVFGKEELEMLYQAMTAHMTEEQKEEILRHYGSMDAYRAHYLEQAGSEQAQKNFQKVVEWFGGDRKSALESGTNPQDPEVFRAYQKRMDGILKRLAEKKGTDVSSFEVKALMGEYDFVAKQLYQMKDVRGMMLDMAKMYREDARMIAAQDAVYGEGASAYLGEAILEFYRQEE